MSGCNTRDQAKGGKRMKTTPQTLVEICHPGFGRSYQEGREWYFQVPFPWIDMDLVGCLETIFKEKPDESEEERQARLYKEVGLFVGRMSGRVLARQPYEDGTPDWQKPQEEPFTPQIPVKISHPMFRKGYQEGRERYFQERYVLHDDVLLNCLQTAFEPSLYPHEREEAREQRLHDEIGQLVGEICGWRLPREPHEEQTKEVQEALLTSVAQKYERTGEALMETIRQFWVVHDQLTSTLDAELFAEVIQCCPPAPDMKRGTERKETI